MNNTFSLLKIFVYAFIFLFVPSMLFAHGGEHHDNAMHEKGSHTRKMSVNGYELTFNITPREISLKIINTDNKNQVRNAVVKLKLLSPDKSEQIHELKNEDDHYENSFSMNGKGTYKALALIKIDGKKHKVGFQYNIK